MNYLLSIGNRTTIYTDEILFFEGEVNYTWIYFKSGRRKVVARTLLFVQQKIEENDFARISRKHLVNRKFIQEFRDDFVILLDKTVLPISRRRKRKVMVENSFKTAS
jgi:DNA-binding LytR/AlgR family response regulator